MRIGKLIYAAVFLGICLTPTIGMAVSKPDENSENRELASLPELTDEEGRINTAFLEDLGNYYTDHFGFRSRMVTVNARIRSDLFGVSAADGVIDGTDGWLYYKDSLRDYLGFEQMSDRALNNAAHSLGMLQRSLAKQGIDFLFVPVPNKNTLYPEHMPAYDSITADGERNYDRLSVFLEKEEVSWLDMRSYLGGFDEVLYHKRDSHWNNRGAALAAHEILDRLGHDTVSWADGEYEIRTDHEGDLDRMLFPAAVTPEEEIYYTRQSVYAYIGEIGSTFDYRISTIAPSREGGLVMYRDSFTNALLPFLADDFGNGFFTRGEPFRIIDIDPEETDAVIVERAERFLPNLASRAPVMAADPITPDDEPEWFLRLVQAGMEAGADEASGGMEEVSADPEGEYYTKIEGKLSGEELKTDSRVFMELGGVYYEAFTCTRTNEESAEEEWFTIYLPSTLFETAAAPARVFVTDAEELKSLGPVLTGTV